MNASYLTIILLLWTITVFAKCPNDCSGNGVCGDYDICQCNSDINGNVRWTGTDCSKRICPRDIAWVGDAVKSNDLHPVSECSNKGICDRNTGLCRCFENYEGLACERTVCPNNCNGRGVCMSIHQLASESDREYSAPWDAHKHYGCSCDIGFRGIDCSMVECPSGPDPMKGHGNEHGRDCSGRGTCDYSRGTCKCFAGFGGTRCHLQVRLFVLTSVSIILSRRRFIELTVSLAQ